MHTITPRLRTDYVDVAHAIGRALYDGSVATAGRRTWLVRPDYSLRVDTGERAPAGGALYAGSAGIALFLSRLGKVVGEKKFARAAREGALHAFDWANAQPPDAFAFWSGAVGDQHDVVYSVATSIQ